MKIKLNKEGTEWLELPAYSEEGIYIQPRLKETLDKIFKLRDNDWDCHFIIDGIEGSGKSTLGKLCAWYLSLGKLTIYNYAKNTKDLAEKIGQIEQGSILICDEGSLSFNSKEVMNREQIQLEKIINVMRQKKLVLIIIAPSFFDLSKGIAVRRARFLLHTYADSKLNRGKFLYWGESRKRVLYEEGKKNYGSYIKPPPDWVGDFTNFKLPFEEEYQKLKMETMMFTIEKDSRIKGDAVIADSLEEQAKKILINNLKERKPLSFWAIQRIFGIDRAFLGRIAKENGLLAPKKLPLPYYDGESEQKNPNNEEKSLNNEEKSLNNEEKSLKKSPESQ